MAIPAYNQSLDNMVSTAIDTYSKDPINALTDSGEKFLKAAATHGRVFVVNDAESVRHPILYAAGDASAYYVADTVSGDPDYGSLTVAAKEILTQSIFNLPAATRNINFPQSQPPGNMIDYVSAVVSANMTQIFNEEEIVFTQGRPAGSSASAGYRRDPHSADADYLAGYPMSLSSIYMSSSAPSSGNAAEDTTAESWANVKTDDIPKWQPTHVTATGTNHTGLIEDLQTAILSASYSESERPTHVYMNVGSFEKMLGLLRDDAALPDPVNADMGKEGTIAFGGVTVDWSRYLLADVIYDVLEAGLTTPNYPILGVNWNSLRLNTVRAGSPGDANLGFIRQLGDLQPHPQKTNLFKRIEWKRQWSCDKGRRSFFCIDGNISIA